jgi:hypothetical protein
MIVGLHCSVMASGTAVIDVDEKEYNEAQQQSMQRR